MPQETKLPVNSQDSSTPPKTEVASGAGSSRSRAFFANKRVMILAFIIVFAVIGTTTLILTFAGSTAGAITGVGGKCLDNSAQRKRNGNKIQLWSCNSTIAQQWRVNSDGTITNVNGYCLDVRGGEVVDRTPVQLWHCSTGNKNQQWVVHAIPNSTASTIVNPQAGLCLDDKYSNTKNGNQVWVWHCNGTNAQRWTITKPAAPAPSPTPTPNPSPSPGPTSGTPSPTPSPSPGPTPNPGGGSQSAGGALCKSIPIITAVREVTTLHYAGAKPTAANTGVPVGTSLTTTLPNGVRADGNTWVVTGAGTIIDSKDLVDKTIDVEANNVTIQNSRIKAPDGTDYAINEGDNVSGLSIFNSEVYTTGGAHTGISFNSNTVLCGVNGHGFQHVAFGDGNNIMVEANYFHINLPAPGTVDPHNGDLDIRGGSHIAVLGNNLTQTNPDESWQHNTSALYLGATWHNITDVMVDRNWFGGGTYSLYAVTVAGQVTPKPSLGAVTIANNRWYRNSYQYGAYASDDNSSWKPLTWANNSFEDNGQAVGQ